MTTTSHPDPESLHLQLERAWLEHLADAETRATRISPRDFDRVAATIRREARIVDRLFARLLGVAPKLTVNEPVVDVPLPLNTFGDDNDGMREARDRE